MRRLLAVLLLLVLGLQSVEPALAKKRDRGKDRHRTHEKRGRDHEVRGPGRTEVALHEGWPLKRSGHVVLVRPAKRAVRVQPKSYLSPVRPGRRIGMKNAAPARVNVLWEDSLWLSKSDYWTQLTLPSGTRGTRLWLDLRGGKAKFDWAEVVYENADAQVVDFKERTLAPGLYSLLDPDAPRIVSHVRMVARATTNEPRVKLMLER